MQERLLSLRTLNFGETVVWECCRTLLNEYHLEEKHENASDDFAVEGHFQPLIRTKVSWQMMEELHTDSIDGGHEGQLWARSRARERAYSNSREPER
jgi:hypothetical protein